MILFLAHVCKIGQKSLTQCQLRFYTAKYTCNQAHMQPCGFSPCGSMTRSTHFFLFYCWYYTVFEKNCFCALCSADYAHHLCLKLSLPFLNDHCNYSALLCCGNCASDNFTWSENSGMSQLDTLTTHYLFHCSKNYKKQSSR